MIVPVDPGSDWHKVQPPPGTGGAATVALSVAIGYCQGTPMRNEIEAHGAEALAAATQVAAEAIAARYGSGPVTGRIRAHVITAGR